MLDQDPFPTVTNKIRDAWSSSSRDMGSEHDEIVSADVDLAEPAVHIAARLGAQYRWHATMCCEAASLRTGVSTAQRGIACGQRGWKRHPEGGLSALGTSPVIASF